MKAEGFDKYQIMIDGSRRLTRRNRRYLRLFTPFQPRNQLSFSVIITSGKRDKLRFNAIKTSNSQQCLSVKNMGGTSSNSWVNAQHVEQ